MFEYMLKMKEYEVDVWGWTETNINWTPNTTNAMKYMSTKIFKNSHIATSNSDDPAGQRQQGGTCTVIINNLVGRKITSGEDKKGLGRWSYIQISGRDYRKTIIITGYKPCIQEQCGDKTVTAQQKRILKMQGSNKTPRKQWDKDLCNTINTWKQEGNKILWMGDLNRGLEDNDVAEIIERTELYDIIGAIHGDTKINSHITGSRQIDFFLGTQGIVETVEKTGILPFYIGIDSDHRGMFCDIDKHQLF